MSGGQVTLPLTLRLAGGAGLGFGAQHSQTADSWFLGVPGLLIAMPSVPSDLIGLLKTAIRSDDPALVTNQLARREAEAAAEDLAARGVSVEIIDPRTLVPFDFDTIAASVRETRRLLVVQEATFPGSWGATLAAWVASNLFDSLACGPSVLGVPEVPAPFAATLESEWPPGRGRITDHVLRLVGQPAGDDVQPVGGGRAAAGLGSRHERIPDRGHRRRRRWPGGRRGRHERARHRRRRVLAGLGAPALGQRLLPGAWRDDARRWPGRAGAVRRDLPGRRRAAGRAGSRHAVGPAAADPAAVRPVSERPAGPAAARGALPAAGPGPGRH